MASADTPRVPDDPERADPVVGTSKPQPASGPRPRPHHRRRRRRPERHRHLFAGRRAVRLRAAVVDAVHLPADDRHPDVSARIGRVTGARPRGQHPRPFSAAGCCTSIVLLLLVANTINHRRRSRRDGRRAASCFCRRPASALHRLLRRWSRYAAGLHALSRYVAVLKWLTLALFAYFATVCHRRTSLGARALRDRSCPQFAWRPDYVDDARRGPRHDDQPVSFFLAGVGGSRGASTPTRPRMPSRGAGAGARARSRASKLDTYLGMAFSNLIAFCIMLTTAATLHADGIDRTSKTSAQAAEALRPIAGRFRLRRCSRSASSAPACSPCRCSPAPAAYALGEATPLADRAFRAIRQEAKAFYCDCRARDARRRGDRISPASIRSRRCIGARCSTAWSPSR